MFEFIALAQARPPDIYAETVALIISVCMVMGMKLVRPIFEERRQAEEEIALMNFVLNSVQEPVFLIDKDARFRYVNEESCRVRGYTREELLGLRVADVDPDFPMERWADHWNELMSARSLIFEGRHKTSDGRIFPVEINANYFEYGRRGRLSISRRDHGGQPGCRKDQGRTFDQMIGRTSDDSQWGAIYEDGGPFPGELHPSMVTLRSASRKPMW